MEKFGGDYRGGVGKSSVLQSTKAALSLKRVKIEEKLLWRGLRSDSRFFPIFTRRAQQSVLDGTN